jgi:hypothetical protein
MSTEEKDRKFANDYQVDYFKGDDYVQGHERYGIIQAIEAGIEYGRATPAPDREMLKRFYYFIDTGFHGAGSLDAVVDKFIAQEITLPKQEG